MDNTQQQPPGGDPQDFWPTQELGRAASQAGPGWGQPPGQAGPGWGQPPGRARPGWGQPPGQGSPPAPPRRRGRAVWWGAGLALVALLAGGGLAAANLTGSASPAPTGPTGQAAQLNTMLNSASSPTSAAAASTFGTTSANGTASANTAGSAAAASRPCLSKAAKLKAAGHPYAAKFALWRCRRRLARVRALGGIHGQFTFQTKSGTRTLAYERGAVESVSGSDIVVQATDGTTWTWVLESNTVIRQHGKRAAASALADGEHVFAGGPVVGGAYDARLIVIMANSGSSSPSPTPSPSSGS